MCAAESPFGAVLSAPRFSIGIRCSETAITAIDFLAPCAPRPPQTTLAKEAVRQLAAYLADAGFRFTLPLAPAGTTFQRRVWAAIAQIPPGMTQSYGALARALGSGARAVGNACGANPYPIVIPCHRVVASDGLGGFAGRRGGFLLDVKRWLLAHEGRR